MNYLDLNGLEIVLRKVDRKLDDLAGTGRKGETVKLNSDQLRQVAARVLLLEAHTNLENVEGSISISFEDIDKETVLDGVWDKENKKMII